MTRFTLLTAVALSLICGNAAGAAGETLVPLSDWKVGLIEGTSLRCFDLDLDSGRVPAWASCTSYELKRLPNANTRVLGNERTVALLSPDRADFFDQAGHPQPRHVLIFAKPVDPALFINGTNSTESDVVRLDGGHLIVSNAIDPASQADVLLACPEALGRKVYDFGWQGFAIIGEQKVLIRDIRGSGKAEVREAQCFPVSGGGDFLIPAGADEVFVYRKEFLGVRRGRAVQFFARDAKLGWVSAATDRQRLLVIPDLNLP